MNDFINKFNSRKNRSYYYPPYVDKYVNLNDNNEQEINTEQEFEKEFNLNTEEPLKTENDTTKDNDNGINILGLNLTLDDIVLGAIIIFLCFESKRDYLLIILLGLILFNISLDSLLDRTKNLDFVKKYVNF